MILVRLYTSEEKIRGVKLSGHGGAARGNDLVCAAVSAVAETALAGLLHYGGDRVSWNLDEGLLSIRILEPPEDDEEHEPLNVIMNTLAIGMREIAREHPERVRVELEQDTGIPDET
jgi:uncharacterized protein YsxB (DUF464 family)